jgi:hypothetical protein
MASSGYLFLKALKEWVILVIDCYLVCLNFFGNYGFILELVL